jgi:steroid 5-alpha reductase family enzyme
MPRSLASRAAAFGWILVAYGAAMGAGFLVVALLTPGHPMWQVIAAADGVATVVVFAFSVVFDNSSVYDPYWSVAPMVIAPALATIGSSPEVPLVRKATVATLVLVWGARLTFNWARSWQGLGHEDWRYAELRRTGRAYWAISFVGFHMMPTIWVYLGCLSLLPALSTGTRPVGVLDAVALAVTAGAIALETIADEQLRAFRLANPSPGRVLDTGVWALCRHPNYLGEMSFWWGLFLFGVAAAPSTYWAVVGPMSITLLFVFVSTPMIDRRSIARRPGYAGHMARIPALLPHFFGQRVGRQGP